MKNRSDYEKRLGEKLEAAYMLEDNGPGMSREEFHRLIMAAEKKKKRRRSLLGLAAACVALCLVCGGFMAGMTMRESASAGKDDETKTVQQGDNAGAFVKTFIKVEDLPEKIKESIYIVDIEGYGISKIKIRSDGQSTDINTYYSNNCGQGFRISEKNGNKANDVFVISNEAESFQYKGVTVYKEKYSEEIGYFALINNRGVSIYIPIENDEIKIEALLDGLII